MPCLPACLVAGSEARCLDGSVARVRANTYPRTYLEEQKGVHVIALDFPPLVLGGGLLFHERGRDEQRLLVETLFAGRAALLVAPAGNKKE